MARKRSFIKRKAAIIAVVGVALLLLAIASGAYTFFVQRGDGQYADQGAGHYNTIIPQNSELRNSVQQQTGCNGGFSPNPCIHSIPEPGTWVLFLAGLVIIILIIRSRK